MSRFLQRPLAFSFRTLIVLVAIAVVLAAWLAAERSLIQRRAAARASWGRNKYVRVVTAPPQGRVQRLRRQLGDQQVESITLFSNATNAELAAAASLFPEASVSRRELLVLPATTSSPIPSPPWAKSGTASEP